MEDVVLITIESLRSDYFDSERFSECWGTFERDFTQFTDAYSNGVATPLSFPTIHTGERVEGDGTLPEQSPTVAESFPGYTWAVSNNPHLRKERGYDRGFDYFYRDLTELGGLNTDTFVRRLKRIGGRSKLLTKLYQSYQTNRYRSPSAGTTAADILSELKSNRNQKGTGLYWVHLTDSHYPFTPWKIPDKDLEVSYDVGEIEAMNNRFTDSSPNTGDIEFLTKMYNELINYIDRQVADFLEYLKNTDQYRDSMIIIMSDHGEGFGEEGIFKYSEGVFSHQWDADPIDSLVRVPLVVKYPGGEYSGETFTHPVQNGDLLATLSEVFDWDIDSPDFTLPFTKNGSRTILSKSNAAIRVTTETGYAIQRQGKSKIIGEVQDDAIETLENEPLPSVETKSGKIPGLDEREQEELEQQLEYLGYK